MQAARDVRQITNTVFKFSLNIFFALTVQAITTSCGSKSISTDAASQNATVPLESERPLPGDAFAIDGTAATVFLLPTSGEARKPVFIDISRVAYSSRRTPIDRWQVFEYDINKKKERRLSFDAGNAEPVGSINNRLVISSSSIEQKAGERVLHRYQSAIAADTNITSSLKHLMLESAARGRTGTEWNQISSTPADWWSISMDREMKTGLILSASSKKIPQTKLAAELETLDAAFVIFVRKMHESDLKSWSEIKVQYPVSASEKKQNRIVSGNIFPDGTRAVWSNGSIVWTTNLKGSNPIRIGDDSLPAANDLVVDPTGQWIVFSSLTDSKGRNLFAVHVSGRCFRPITLLQGDEIEPTFSPDGHLLLFTFQNTDRSQIAKIAFGLTTNDANKCP